MVSFFKTKCQEVTSLQSLSYFCIMLSIIEEFYENQQEPIKSCLWSLRKIILDFDPDIKETWKYQIPFFMYKNKMFCYLYKQKKSTLPYIGFAKGNLMKNEMLEKGNRKKMKVLPIDPELDIPKTLILEILEEAKKLY